MNLAQQPRLRLVTLCALYTAQGIPTGFVLITLTTYLAGQGLSVGQVATFTAFSQLPWAAKLLYGPLLDRYAGSPYGRRRPWLLAAQAGMLLTLAAMMALPGLAGRFVLLTAFVALGNLFNSLQDVAADGLAVDLLRPSERGFANGMMWSGKALGIAIGGAGMNALLGAYGLDAALALQFGLLAAVAVLPALVVERPGDRRFPWQRANGAEREAPDELGSFRELGAELLGAFRGGAALTTGLLALLASLPTRMLAPVGPTFAVQVVGWSDEAYTQFASGPLLLAGAAGAIAGGWLADRFGMQRMIATAALGIGLLFSLITALEAFWQATPFVVGFLLAGGFLDMMLKTALFALFMSVARARVAATQFTIYMALGNLCNVLGSVVIIPLDFYFDFRGIFFSAALLSLVPLALLVRLRAAAPVLAQSRSL